MNKLINILRETLLKQKMKDHRTFLENNAMIGKYVNSASFTSKNYILRLNINNFSKEKDRIIIGDNCNLSLSIFCNYEGSVKIGDFVFMNEGCLIRVDHSVEIGSHCLFGPRVHIWDTDNHPLSRSARHKQAEIIPLERINTYDADGGPIKIGNDVWLCMDVLVLGGVTIGDGSIVAAKSVVTKDIPPMKIAAGIPAKIIGDVPE